MKIEIEQLMELEEGKTYYIRLPEGTSREDVNAFVKNFAAMELKSKFIVGVGEFNIEDVSEIMGE